jgi:hypothetical protein
MLHYMTRTAPLALFIGLSCLIFACEPQYIPEWLGGGWGRSKSPSTGSFTGGGRAFTEELVQARTFTNGTAVTTVTHLLNDADGSDLISDSDVLLRKPFGIDFNGDGKIDPVVGYGGEQAVIQILLSDPDTPRGSVKYTSLTLDSKRDMKNLTDVAVGDIDRDGALDIVAAAEEAVWYFHHPSDQPTTVLSAWGNPDPNDELRERIDASYTTLSDSEILSIITQAVGPGVNINDYIVTVEQRYSNVQVGDLDNDGDADVVASRAFIMNFTPRPEVPVEAIQIVDGDVTAFINPGFATTGHNWTAISVGVHERQTRLDRDGATGLLLYDLDGDGDLDVISAAGKDNNAQVAWFENPVENRPGAPGPGLLADVPWTQWRIGSVRDAWSIDVADLTGDGRPDVVATGGEQQQMLLFVQPDTGPARSYDWDTYVLVTFEAFQPHDVKVVDVDSDGVLEIVVGGTEGAVRYFENTGDATEPWHAVVVTDFKSGGDVGWLGYGDVDGDGDYDLVAVITTDEDNDSRVSWIRNETIALPGTTP